MSFRIIIGSVVILITSGIKDDVMIEREDRGCNERGSEKKREKLVENED